MDVTNPPLLKRYQRRNIMSLINRIETHIKSWFKVTFFMWIWIYPYAYLKIKFTGEAPSEELSVWANFGYDAFGFLIGNAIIPYYIVKGLLRLIQRYPTQSKFVVTALLTSFVYEAIQRSKH